LLLTIELLIWVAIFFSGYLVIYYSADYLIDQLEEFSEVFTISPVIVGMFILGIDLEESIVSLIAAQNGLPYLSLGNLIGNSIIAITIVFGLPALFLVFRFEQLPLFYYSTLLMATSSIVLSMMFPALLLSLALSNLVIFGLYTLYSVKVQMEFKKALSSMKFIVHETGSESSREGTDEKEGKMVLVIKILLATTLVFTGGQLLVISAEGIVLFTGLSETFFGLVITAFVTNVEEFWLIVKAIQKGQTELGVSAQIGKLLWNTTIIFGLSGLLIGQFDYQWIMVASSLIFLGTLMFLLLNLARKSLSKRTGLLHIMILLVFLILNVVFIL
jgi:Ca2+/Na+ antiporter